MNKERNFFVLIIFGGLLLVATSLYSITQGATSSSFSELKILFENFDETNPLHLLVRDVRIPRVIVASLIGFALAISGAIIQGITRNPMADPGIMGVNSGAVFMISVCYAFFSGLSFLQITFISFLGSLFSASLIYGISKIAVGGNNPLKLVLGGTVICSFFISLSQGIALATDSAQRITYWTMGSVAGSSWNDVYIALPVVVFSFVISMLISRQLTLLSIGDELSKSLGVNIGLIQKVAILVAVALASISVALAGMISFVGILVPHIAKKLIGNEFKFMLPVCGLYGAIIVSISDLLAKTLIAPSEIPIGALISVIGVPVFLVLARRNKNEK
ncbi:MAG: FecCD family ABC transporter permease [Lachnospirales bacterium]